MGHYELRGRERVWVEDKPLNQSTNTQNSSYNRYSTPSYHSNNISAKIFSILLPIVCFSIGQIIQYAEYSLSNSVLLMDFVFASISINVLFISTILGIISIIHIIVRSWKLADDNLPFWSWLYIIVSGILFLIIPCVSGFLGIIITSVISWCVENCTEWFIFLFLILMIGCIILIVKISPKSGLGEYDLKKISEYSEINQYTDLETVALDISDMDENFYSRIETGANCKVLVLLGNKRNFYKGLEISTNASKIVLKNLNISFGAINIKSNNCTIKLIGKNSVIGKNGYSGGVGQDGGDGESAIVASGELILTGTGDLTLTGGSGGNGGNGKSGSDSGIFGNGESGGRGGDGGNSAYVIICSNLSAIDFRGIISLTRGKAGSGGNGGKGGSGGLFGSTGSYGDSGWTGLQRDYCTGTINIDDKNIKYN